MNKPKVTIVTVNWNNHERVIEFLNSVYKSNYPNYDVVVIDNGSTKGDPQLIKEAFPQIDLIKNNVNKGLCAALNLAVPQAIQKGSKYIWFINNDVSVEENTLSQLINTMELDDKIGLISPVIYYFLEKNKIQNCGAEILPDEYMLRHLMDLEKMAQVPKEKFLLWGTAFLVKSYVAEKIEGFPIKNFLYFEDFVYCENIKRAGYTCEIDQKARIYHKYHDVETKGKNNIPPHVLFYITRNEYWFWMQRLKGFEKLKFSYIFVKRILEKIAVLDLSDRKTRGQAYLAGLYCGFKNIGGQWNKDINMPKGITNLVIRRACFFTDLLSGRLVRIVQSGLMRLKRVFFIDNT